MCLKVLCQCPLRMCTAYFWRLDSNRCWKAGTVHLFNEWFSFWVHYEVMMHHKVTLVCPVDMQEQPFCENQAIKRHNVWAWLQSSYTFRSWLQVLLLHTDIREVRRSKKTFVILATYTGMWTAEKKELLEGYYSTSDTRYTVSYNFANVATLCK